MLKFGEVNPLNVFGLRRLEHCAPHLVSVDFDLRCDPKVISDWVYENLSGRFYFGEAYFLDERSRVQITQRVSFEEPGEAMLFGLMMDQINIRPEF